MSKATANIEPIVSLCERYDLSHPFPITAWVDLPVYRINIYARRTKRWIDGELAETLDLASFEIDEESRGKGLFTEMLGLIEDYAWSKDLTIFVECVHNDRLRGFLSRRGYSTSGVEELCYFKRKSNATEAHQV